MGSYLGRGECRVPTQPEHCHSVALHWWTWMDQLLLRRLPHLALCSPLGPGTPLGWVAWENSSASTAAAGLCSSTPPHPHWDKDMSFSISETSICLDVCGWVLGLINPKENLETQQQHSHLPEFTVEVPEAVEAEPTEVQEILLLEVRGVLQSKMWKEGVCACSPSYLMLGHFKETKKMLEDYSHWASHDAFQQMSHKYNEVKAYNDNHTLVYILYTCVDFYCSTCCATFKQWSVVTMSRVSCWMKNRVLFSKHSPVTASRSKLSPSGLRSSRSPSFSAPGHR